MKNSWCIFKSEAVADVLRTTVVRRGCRLTPSEPLGQHRNTYSFV